MLTSPAGCAQRKMHCTASQNPARPIQPRRPGPPLHAAMSSPQVASLLSSGLQHRKAIGPLCPRSTCRRTTTLPCLLPLPAPPAPPPPGVPLSLPLPAPPAPPPPGVPLSLPLPLCPLRSTSQMMAVWSLPHEASMRPLWEKDRCHTSSVWSSSTCKEQRQCRRKQVLL